MSLSGDIISDMELDASIEAIAASACATVVTAVPSTSSTLYRVYSTPCITGAVVVAVLPLFCSLVVIVIEPFCVLSISEAVTANILLHAITNTNIITKNNEILFLFI